MAADIFGREASTYGGSFAADGAKMTFAGGGEGAGTLVQNIQLNYQQNVQKLYEVGSNQIYLVGGRTQGTGTIGRIIGPKKLNVLLYNTYGNICNVSTNALAFTFSATCKESAGAVYTCQMVLVTGLGFNLQAADMMINEQVEFMFSGLTTTYT